MNSFIIEGTENTPDVVLDPERAVFEIRGKSMPQNAEVFYKPVLDWFDVYGGNPCGKTEVVFNMDFFNISSSKRILFILYKLNEIVENGFEVSVKWHYDENDDDMFEVGQDYAFMVNVPFEFVRRTHEEIAPKVMSVA